MILNENIYFLILFTLPAALHIIYHRYIRHVPRINNDKTIELSECILFCFCVFFINLLIMGNDMQKLVEYLLADNKSTYCIKTGFNYLGFIKKYFVVNLAVSIAAIVVWYAFLIKIYRRIMDRVNHIKGWPQEYSFGDVWRNVFETKEIVDVADCAVKIEKSGTLIAAGLLKAFPSPHVEHRELVLYNTDYVKELFEEDKDKQPKDRVFPEAVCEYYDINNDLVLKFYALEKYDSLNDEEEHRPE